MLDEWSKHKSTSRLLAENLFRDLLAAPSWWVIFPYVERCNFVLDPYLSRIYLAGIYGAGAVRLCSPLLDSHTQRKEQTLSLGSSGSTVGVLLTTHTSTYRACRSISPALCVRFQDCTYIIRAVFIIDVYHQNIRTNAALRRLEEEEIFYSPIYTRPAQTCAR